MIASFLRYFKRLLDSHDNASMKRFIILIVSLHFILSSFMVLFGIVRHTVDKDMMRFILDCDFYIILVGLGVISVENVASIIVERVKGIATLLKDKKETKNEDL